MSKRVVEVLPDSFVQEAAEKMVRFNISGIAVVEDDVTYGVITMKDIFKKAIANRIPTDKVLVKSMMSSPAITIHPLDSIEKASEKMKKNNIKRLVVVDQKKSPKGIITAMDIVKNTQGMVDLMFETWVRPNWDD